MEAVGTFALSTLCLVFMAVQVCWVPIFKAKKLILAGDPMQLPPTILSTDKKRDKKLKNNNKKKDAPESSRKSGDKQLSEVSVPSAKKDKDAIAQEVVDSSSSTSEDEIDKDKAPAMPADDGAGSRRSRANGLTPPRSLETTLFDRLEKMYGPGIKRLLNVQYRYFLILYLPSRAD